MLNALIDHTNKVIMDWSPKAGCTIATKMFFRKMGILEEALKLNDWVHIYRVDVFFPNNPVRLKMLLDPSYVKFKIVRNPYDRFVSIYIHAMIYSQVKDENDQRIDLTIRQFAFLFFGDVNKGDVDMIKIFHFSKQKKDYEYLHPNIFNYICKLENLSEDLNKLNEETGLNYSLEGLSSSHHVDRDADINYCVADKRWSEIKDCIPESKWFYDKKLAMCVRMIYHDDFETYGY